MRERRDEGAKQEAGRERSRRQGGERRERRERERMTEEGREGMRMTGRLHEWIDRMRGRGGAHVLLCMYVCRGDERTHVLIGEPRPRSALLSTPPIKD